jgi:hypothetical protein
MTRLCGFRGTVRMGTGRRARSVRKEETVPGPSGSALGGPWEVRNCCGDMVAKTDHLEGKTAVGCSSPARYHHKVTDPSASRGTTKRGFHGPMTGRSSWNHIAPSDSRLGD